jgi:hypothetical protein
MERLVGNRRETMITKQPILAGCAVYAFERSHGLFSTGILAHVPALSPMLVAITGPRVTGRFTSETNPPIAQIGIAYEMLAVALCGLWIFDYLPRAWQPFALATLGLAFLAAPLYTFDLAKVTPPNHLGYVQFPAALLLIFGLQWLRKAIFRSAGFKGVLMEGLEVVFIVVALGPSASKALGRELLK